MVRVYDAARLVYPLGWLGWHNWLAQIESGLAFARA
jgi:hypothetical protein